ncbi:hypothetical protein ARTHRO9AX_220092 [Arthrobacter sp. 9AX]|uniref:hypothetical protein n=1 Tax=Arthrobacter sp. 9AX TaxID=2653131 RepID=UPI0012F12257|nr:hypothetical protein [Arthrobacter sp. 9AX]VXC14931.1 hypothetical protein ARTHRO9AX_220092 [Arthrobacter sp. 9AX]
MNTETLGSSTLLSFFPAESPTFDCKTGSYDGAQMAGPRYRQIFSDDFVRLAVNWTDPATNSKRVGYVDSTSGTTVDVTSLLSKIGDFVAAPQHDNALFAPDGRFFFHDIKAKTHNWIDLKTKELQSSPVEGNGSSWWIGLDGLPESTYNMTGMGYAKEIRTADPKLVIDLFNDTQVNNWLDSSRALAVVDGRLGVLSPLPDDVNHQGGADFLPITPESDFRIRSYIADPSLKTVFFTAMRGAERFFFTVPSDGSAAPTRHNPLNPQEDPVFIAYLEKK